MCTCAHTKQQHHTGGTCLHGWSEDKDWHTDGCRCDDYQGVPEVGRDEYSTRWVTLKERRTSVPIVQ